MGEGRAVWPEQLDAVSLGVLPGTAAQMLRTLIIGRLIVEEHEAITNHLLTLTGPLELVGAAGTTGDCCTVDGKVKVHEGVSDGSAREDQLDALGFPCTCLRVLLGPPVADNACVALYCEGTLVRKSLMICYARCIVIVDGGTVNADLPMEILAIGGVACNPKCFIKELIEAIPRFVPQLVNVRIVNPEVQIRVGVHGLWCIVVDVVVEDVGGSTASKSAHLEKGGQLLICEIKVAELAVDSGGGQGDRLIENVAHRGCVRQVMFGSGWDQLL